MEIVETGETFTHPLTSGVLAGFESDTITLATLNFTKGTSTTLKAYFSALFDKDVENDTIETSIAINPELSVRLHAESSSNNLLPKGLPIYPTITLYNTGNMDLTDIDLTFRIDTGDNREIYTTLHEIYTGTLLAGDSNVYVFNQSYSVPTIFDYLSRISVYLVCNPTLDANHAIQEYVDIKDLHLLRIDNPTGIEKDTIESAIKITVALANYSDNYDFPNTGITVVVTNSQDVEMETITESIPSVSYLLPENSYTFNSAYTVPNDSVYYLTVYVSSGDQYLYNDTLPSLRRETVKKPEPPKPPAVKEIEKIEGFTLGQNIPNPANNTTRIDYTIPETGKVIFHLHNISGQLLYSKTIEAVNGSHSIELNTNTLSAGVYFYSIEYKGRRLVKRMSVK
jgi:hypothetical protein